MDLPPPTLSAREASRFLIQASFGPNADEIARVQQIGCAAWIDDQLARPPGKHLPVLDAMRVRENGKIYNHHRKFVWWQQAVTAADQLRQRVAYAWSQHFVVSDKDDSFGNSTDALCDYYDTLLVHGLGSFRDLLRAVTYSPCMGKYLTYLGNEKASADGTRRPDENFAREVMQLFTIGLHELNADGSPQIKDGRPVPTYDNDDVREMARVFTGIHWAGHAENFYWGPQRWLEPLQVYDAHHDQGRKVLLGGRKVLPADQGAAKDIDDALDCLCEHPNTPPFVCRFLIERLTTSNPSAAYFGRVVQAFLDNGRGIRGDLGAVVRAILLDPEVRRADHPPDAGKLREPYLRLVALVRAFRGAPKGGMFSVAYLDDLLGQEPGSAASVFNFYLPDYSPPGRIGDRGMVAPEFEITNDVTAISLPNFLRDCVYQGGIGRWDKDLHLDFTHEVPLADRPDDLLARVGLLLTGDRLSARSREVIRGAVEQIPPAKAEERVKLAVYLTSICAESAVQI